MAQETKRSGTRSRPSGAAAKRTTRSTPRSNAKGDGKGTAKSTAKSTARGSAKNVVVPVATAVLGAAAGVLIGRRNKPHKKVLGVPMPGTGGSGVDGLAKEVRKAGKQFGHLAEEIQITRKKAEEIGKAIS